MKKAKKDAVKQQLKRTMGAGAATSLNFCACGKLDGYYGYWIGDEVGGVYDYGDGMFTINMDDIIYCVADVTREQYIEWQEYICDA